MNDNALSFVGQIMTAYKAILKAEGNALDRAIECGKYLALAKENVEATKPKRKWSAWLKEHCPDIHQNTAALYMRLADPDNADVIADCTSIREADMKLRQPRKQPESNPDEGVEDDSGEDDNSQRVVRPKDVSPDLTMTLMNVSADEVCRALIDAWERDQVADLVKRLTDHLKSPTKMPTLEYRRPTAPSAPSV